MGKVHLHKHSFPLAHWTPYAMWNFPNTPLFNFFCLRRRKSRGNETLAFITSFLSMHTVQVLQSEQSVHFLTN